MVFENLKIKLLKKRLAKAKKVGFNKSFEIKNKLIKVAVADKLDELMQEKDLLMEKKKKLRKRLTSASKSKKIEIRKDLAKLETKVKRVGILLRPVGKGVGKGLTAVKKHLERVEKRNLAAEKAATKKKKKK
jgi:hypothetical protein